MTFNDVYFYIKNKINNSNDELIFSIFFNCSKVVKSIEDFVTYRNHKSDINLKKINKNIKKIIKGYPIERILKKVNFYGSTFKVFKNVFIPRSETELLIDKAIEYSKFINSPIVFDLCCGSGVIGLSYKIKRIDAKVFLIDISKKAIKNTIDNANEKKMDVTIIRQDCFQFLKEYDGNVDLIISNPPYIDKKDRTLDKLSKKYNPKKSLFAKNNGIYFYEKIIDFSIDKLSKKGTIIFEIGHNQKKSLLFFLKRKFPNLKYEFFKDYANNDRILIIKK